MRKKVVLGIGSGIVVATVSGLFLTSAGGQEPAVPGLAVSRETLARDGFSVALPAAAEAKLVATDAARARETVLGQLPVEEDAIVDVQLLVFASDGMPKDVPERPNPCLCWVVVLDPAQTPYLNTTNDPAYIPPESFPEWSFALVDAKTGRLVAWHKYGHRPELDRPRPTPEP